MSRDWRALISSHWLLSLVAVVGALVLIAVALAAPRIGSDGPDFSPEQVALQAPITYNAGADTTWTRQTTGPATTYVKIEAIGASGCTSSSCGKGAKVTLILPVSTDLTIKVGSRPSGSTGGSGWSRGGNSSSGHGTDGKGGGGSSGVQSGSTVIAVAAGAGGQGGYDQVGAREGGDGGTPTGQRGDPSSASSGNGQGGGGGSISTAGTGGANATGIGCNQNGRNGSGSGNGGDGATADGLCESGGGGGGGYTGGGGGGNGIDRAGGGGGGASYANPGIGATSIAYSNPSESTDPSITITPLNPPTAVTSAATSISSSSAVLNGTINGQGLSTTAQFLWGTTASPATAVTATPSPVTGSTDQSISYTLGSLQPATTYYYRSRANNGLGGNIDGSVLSFDTAPNAPTLGAFNHGDGTLTINWTRTSDGGATLSTWSVQTQNCTASSAATCSGSWTDINAQVAITGASTTATATGLTNGVYYRVRVAGVGANATGPYAMTSAAEFPSATASGVTASATNVTGSSATLNATAGSGGATTTVVFKYSSTDSSAQTGTSVTATGSPLSQTATGSNSLSANISGLTSSTRYYYRAHLTNRDGTTQTSPVMILDTHGAPSAPTLDSVTPVVDGLQINWTPGPDNGSAITSWSVQQCTLSSITACNGAGGAGWINVTANPALTANSVTTTATGIQNGTRYWIRVGSTNAEGSSPYANSTFKFMPLADTANRENFNQGGNEPVGTVSPTDIVITPLANGATDAKSIGVTATDLDGVASIARVNLCLYFDDPSAPNANGDCNDADLNPANQVLLTWSRDTDDFSVQANPLNGPSDWSMLPNGAGSTSGFAAGGVSLDMTFSFRASEVMREADYGKWKVALYVADDDALFTLKPAPDIQIKVNHFSAITVARGSYDFGILEFGGVGQANNVSAGTVVSNGATDITYRLDTNFKTDDNSSILQPVAGGLEAQPSIGEYLYACTPDSNYTDTNAVRVPVAADDTGSVEVEADTTAIGTPEYGFTDITQSCQLKYGGSVGVSGGTEYSADVITGTQRHVG